MHRTGVPRKLKGRVFTTQEAIKTGLTFYDLRKMIGLGVVHKVRRGLFQAAEADFSEDQAFAAASLRIGSPSAICLVSALVHYQLSDSIPKKVWMMVDATKRTQYRDIRLLRTRNPRWSVGIEKKDGYRITSLERTLVDAIIYRNLIGTNLAMEALRKAIKNSTVTLGSIIDMSRRLEVYHRTRPYFEALA